MTQKSDFRILIIDDNQEIHSDFYKILTNPKSNTTFNELNEKIFGKKIQNKTVRLPNFQIDTATQGKEGFEKIADAIKQGNPYSLAFVDVRMPPGWDGIETVKHIWDLDKNIQIVICTAYSDYSWEETISELGQSDNLLILKKPFDSVAVRQLACALTAKWQLVNEAQSYTQSLEMTVKLRTEELQYQATHDSLTQLPNRVLLQERLQTVIDQADKSEATFAVVFFDLDRFKLINDSLNHAAGDELLSIISQRLQSKIRDGDMLSRLGGDEFVLVVQNLLEPDEIVSAVSTILETIRQPVKINNHRLSITSSAGICIYLKNKETISDLIRNADAAMYRAKELGGNQYQFYADEMNQANLNRLEMESDLRHAIIAGEFSLYYQPQYDIKKRSLVAVEALLRWNHPTKGLVLPLDFIPLAESTGMITSIGEWALREACKQNKAWQNAGLAPIRVAVNVTTQQLRQLNFVGIIKSVLDESGLEPQYLELELTENALINNVVAEDIINALREIGIQISVDDFGTGYSSLNYLRHLPLDRLKIDKSFVQNIQKNHGDEIIIRAIIEMAKGLDLDIMAEGVETQAQLNFLKDQKCGNIQGYFFSQPLTAEELTALLKDPDNIKNAIIKMGAYSEKAT